MKRQPTIVKDEYRTIKVLPFGSVGSFNDFVEEEFKYLNTKNESVWRSVLANTKTNIASNPSWYGSLEPKSIKDLYEHDVFNEMELVKKVQSELKRKLHQFLQIKEHLTLPDRKLSYTSRGIGVFSFDRAALGLFNKSLKDNHLPLGRVINQINIELGRDRIQTSIRDVYATFENQDKPRPAFSIYVKSGANANVSGKDMYFIGASLAVLSEYLESSGFPLEIRLLHGTFIKTINTSILADIKLKGFDENLNLNKLMLLSSDPGHFRFNGFRGLIALANNQEISIPLGLGSSETKSSLSYIKSNPKKNQLLFGESYSLESSLKEIEKVLQTLKDRTRS